MTLHSYDTNTPGDTVKVEAPRKSAAKKKARAKAKRRVVKKTPKNPPKAEITTTEPIDPIEDAIMNPEPQPKRER